ncbi:MAG TPA: hypothetical protein VM802_26415 [Chitinophaga sp.]|uniref:terpene synthase family protein n=1 Tax=Chitinophaga sp. TaxID=1869181 RepID=UPI002C2816BC|nr:hypothetical protein [Chitinophaga sp.]HVI48432.1 hypothetical protein [Chitinophaga sp.]
MTTIQLPRISYPFPSRINQFAAEAQQHVTDWAQHYGLVRSERAIARFNRGRFASLAARAFPDAPFFELCVIADFNTWLFMLDDQCDEADAGKTTDYLRSITSGFMDILRFNQYVTSATAAPLAASLGNIWERMRSISTPGWRLRFIRSMEDYFSSCIWEAENRERGIVPAVADYIKMRPYTGGLYADIVAIDIIEKIYLPDDLLQHALLKRLMLACNNIVCWSNDLFSCDKELKQGDVHNLVVTLQHANHLTLQEAVDEAARMHNEEVAIFAALEKLVPLSGTEKDYELLRYVSVLRSWITGNLEWSIYDTGRYGLAVNEAAVV